MRNKLIIPILLVIALAIAGGFYYTRQTAAAGQTTVLSGTIEATETNLSTISGGRVKQIYVAEGDPVRKGQDLMDLYSEAANVNESITAPIDGVVLERLVELNEVAAPGATVVVIAPLDALTLKIYVPEDLYGRISLGQTYPISVDSFPGMTFSGKVSNISDQAEFTPRNVQTKDSRKTTVYAVRLDVQPSGGKLKPGMPADVTLSIQ